VKVSSKSAIVNQAELRCWKEDIEVGEEGAKKATARLDAREPKSNVNKKTGGSHRSSRAAGIEAAFVKAGRE
jgi:hypothetical protein